MGRCGFVEGELGEAALVVDGHCGPVLHRAPDVVDADVVAEDGAGVGVLQFDGRAGEADERRVGERVAHVAGEAVYEVVLAAVRLVCDDDDVAALGERGVRVPLLLREELLDGSEDDAPGLDRQFAAQVGTALRLRGWLAEQIAAAGERGEELIVEVIAGRSARRWLGSPWRARG